MSRPIKIDLFFCFFNGANISLVVVFARLPGSNCAVEVEDADDKASIKIYN